MNKKKLIKKPLFPYHNQWEQCAFPGTLKPQMCKKIAAAPIAFRSLRAGNKPMSIFGYQLCFS